MLPFWCVSLLFLKDSFIWVVWCQFPIYSGICCIRASLVAQLIRIRLQCRRPQFDSRARISWRRDRLPTPVFLGFFHSSGGKQSACNMGDLGSIPGSGRSPGGGHGNPLQYSCPGNFHGQKCLVGHSSWGHKEADTTEQLSTCYTNKVCCLHNLSSWRT